MMSEGQTLRRIVTARARLVHETYKSQARLTLKLKRYVKSETAYDAFKAFQVSVGELANKKSWKRVCEGNGRLPCGRRVDD